MTFAEILSRIVDGTPGALAGAIMGRDGIPVEEYERVRGRVDLTAVAVEFERVLDQASKVAGALFGRDQGGLEEVVLATRSQQLLFYYIDDEYFLVIALERTGSLGKARYLIRSVLQSLQEEL
jgi:predicted regulator of Ras-like GTPase activity (Roadblock/LC7/MglB family)